MKLYLKSGSPPPGVGGALGSEIFFTPDSGYTRIVLLGIRLDVRGTFASGEVITVRITLYFDDGSYFLVDKSYTTTGTYYLTDGDFFSLWKNGVGVTRIGVRWGSSASTTNVTLTVYVRGVQY
jgi:hypothetical protein